MKLRNRIILDTAMLLLFIALQVININNAAIHEIIAVAFIALIVVHCLLNRKWIRKIHKAKFPRATINLLLFALFAMAVTSGIMLSDFLFGQAGVDRWHVIHGWSTRIMIAAVLLHLIDHRKMLMGVLFRIKVGVKRG